MNLKKLSSAKPKTEVTQMAGFEVNFSRKKVRNINLRIRPSDASIQISAPLTVSRKVVEGFVASRAAWISEAQQRVRQRQSIAEPQLTSGSEVMLFGKALGLSVQQLDTQITKKSFWRHEGDKLYLSLRNDQDQGQAQQLLDNFYRQKLSDILPDLVEVWQPLVGVEASVYRLRKMKTRWGSCNIHKGRIWMSLELAKYPVQCIEYVLVHELTHLLEPSHNKRFHRLVGEVMPDWKERNNFLNRGLNGGSGREL